MKDNTLVSIIIPTKNSESVLENCLKSIRSQTYSKIEIIVVDNNSTDRTLEIANKYADSLYTKGPERTAQRNYGAKKARGAYLLFVDSDMELTKNVVKECVSVCNTSQDRLLGALIIPELSFGKGFWAKCKALERSYYLNVEWIECQRFFLRQVFIALNGYDESMVSGEDWDLNQRLRKKYHVGRISSFIRHNEGTLTLRHLLKKKMYYAQKISLYSSKQINKGHFNKQANLFNRYALYFSNPKKLFADPFVGVGMLFMRACEFSAGVVGYISAKKLMKN